MSKIKDEAGKPPVTEAPAGEIPGKGTQTEESPAARNARFRALARQAPESPGVYVMRDRTGAIIYVGKAKILKNRLSSYFSGRKDIKTRHLVSRVESIEWILAGSEYEAVLL